MKPNMRIFVSRILWMMLGSHAAAQMGAGCSGSISISDGALGFSECMASEFSVEFVKADDKRPDVVVVRSSEDDVSAAIRMAKAIS